jgi:5-formyltetrahydrofolate cyclo-ligase
MHARKSLQAARAVARLPAFRAGARIAAYLPFDGEVDTAALIATARARGLRVYVPVVASRRHRTLRFHPLTTALRDGSFGIAIPRHPRRPVAPRWLNLMLVPLVGVDPEGRRLGMGGGFYDRALRFRRQRRRWRGPLLIGFAFDCQRVPSVDAQPWDLTLDGLATESGIIKFGVASTR